MGTIEIPDSQIALVIGQRGAGLTRIAAETGTKVDVPREKNANGCRLLVCSGTAEQFEHVKALVAHIVAGDRPERARKRSLEDAQLGSQQTQELTSMPALPSVPLGAAALQMPLMQPMLNLQSQMLLQPQLQQQLLQSQQQTQMLLAQLQPQLQQQLQPQLQPQLQLLQPQLQQQLLQASAVAADHPLKRANTAGPLYGAGSSLLPGLSAQAASSQLRLLIECERCGAIIGTAGSGLEALKEASGATFTLERDVSLVQGYRLLTIEGGADKQAAAVLMVCQQLAGAGGIQAESIGVKLLFPADKAGLVIGRGGTNLKTINQECGVRLEAQREAVGAERVLGVTGGPAGVCAAICSVLNRLATAAY